jgi:hypothetical protein
MILFEYRQGEFLLRPAKLRQKKSKDAGEIPNQVSWDPINSKYLVELRAQLSAHKLAQFGISQVEDSVLATAVDGGVVGSPAFRAIIAVLKSADCLCCFSTKHYRVALKVELQLLSLLRFFSQENYERSQSFYQQLGVLSRDFLPAEAEFAGRHFKDHMPKILQDLPCRPGIHWLATQHSTPSVLATRGILAAAGISLWLCSTPHARRFIRHLAGSRRVVGLSLCVRVAAGSSAFHSRVRGRLYTLEFFSGDIVQVISVLSRLKKKRK